MIVQFAKTFECAGQQLLVRRCQQPLVCPCDLPNCVGFKMGSVVSISTYMPDAAFELVMMIRGTTDTPEGAQQLIDLFGPADASEGLEILQANFYEVENGLQSHERVAALRESIVSRITAAS